MKEEIRGAGIEVMESVLEDEEYCEHDILLDLVLQFLEIINASNYFL